MQKKRMEETIMNVHLQLSRQRAYANIYEGNAIGALLEFIADLEEHPDTRDHPAIEEGRRRIGDDIRTAVAAREFLDAVA